MHKALGLIPFETGLTAKLCVFILGRSQRCFHPFLRMRDETMILILFFSCLVFCLEIYFVYCRSLHLSLGLYRFI